MKTLNKLSLVYSALNLDISPLVMVWLNQYQSALKHKGKASATKLMKEYLTLSERYALHQPVKPLPFRKSDKNGFPKAIKVFKPWLRSRNSHKVRAALSVLRTVEELRLEISKDITSVTENPRWGDLSPILDFASSWVKRFSPLYLDDLKYHLTSKNGPNGPALATSDKDLGAISNSHLMAAVVAVSKKLYDDSPPTEEFKCTPGGVHSRLQQFPEKSGKTRTIAIIDYYSQRALHPLHDALMGVLKKLESDGTYSHRNVGVYAQHKTKEKSFAACFDLSNATDRFPWPIQAVLLDGLLKPELAEAYQTLLHRREFKVSWSDDIVVYAAGQPMGAYGSWPLFALAHHCIVEYCAKTLRGVKHKYRLIGDDLMITDEAMAQRYVEVMKTLGVDINLDKSVLSQAQSPWSACEVAKQLYLNGIQLTPVTPGILRTSTNPLLINQMLEELEFRKLINPESLPTLIRKLLPKKQSYEKGLLLLENPINGFVLRFYPGNTVTHLWDPFPKDQVVAMYNLIRLRNLQRQIDAIDVYVFQQRPESVREDGTSHPEAILLTKEQLDSSMKSAFFRLSCADPKSEQVDLMGVEYLADPADPFGDLKRRKARAQSSLVLETYELLKTEQKPDVIAEIIRLNDDNFVQL